MRAEQIQNEGHPIGPGSLPQSASALPKEPFSAFLTEEHGAMGVLASTTARRAVGSLLPIERCPLDGLHFISPEVTGWLG
jgi:hypothetical protein